MNMLMDHRVVGGALFVLAAVLAGIMVYKYLEDRAIRKEERHQQYLFEADLYVSKDPWNGTTYAYPQSWEWPQDQSVTRFLNAAPATQQYPVQQPVIGIRTSGETAPLSETDEWILQMYADTDKFIAQMNAPLATPGLR